MRSSPTSHGSPSDSEPIPESADVALAAPPVAADPAASPAPSAGTAPTTAGGRRRFRRGVGGCATLLGDRGIRLLPDERLQRRVVLGGAAEVRVVADALVARHRLEVAFDEDLSLIEHGYAVTHVRDDAHVVFDDHERRAAVVERL